MRHFSSALIALGLLIQSPSQVTAQTNNHVQTKPSPLVVQQSSNNRGAQVSSLGAAAFRQCATCHTLKAGQPNMAGPNLFQFFGKRVGTSNSTFRYSAAFRSSTLTWNQQTLDQFLTNARQTIPGTSMASIGVSDAQRRVALIEFLKQETK